VNDRGRAEAGENAAGESMQRGARAIPLLVTAKDLQARLGAGGALPVDCRFAVTAPAQGRAEWAAGHIPGAHYAHLDDDLAGPVSAGSGRHPLPDPDRFAAFLARCGWSPGRPIVAYDRQGGAFAARLWWLMRYFGHDVVALLDGGFDAWLESGGAVEAGETASPSATADASRTTVKLRPAAGLICPVHAVEQGLAQQSLLLIDARDAGRFAGEKETIDPVAGHVPGASNRPFMNNLDGNGRFRSPEALRVAFEALLRPGRAPAGGTSTPPGASSRTTVHMCGSGVTACHNLFAMTLAGLDAGQLYPGSWSGWISRGNRPVATGPT